MLEEGRIDIYCDGGARGNPGPASIGFVAKSRSGKTIVRRSAVIGNATNNSAEYKAVIAALTWVTQQINQKKLKPSLLRIFLDSRLVVNQLRGNFKVKDKNLKELVITARTLESKMGLSPQSENQTSLVTGPAVQYVLIPREENSEADALVNDALDGASIIAKVRRRFRTRSQAE